MSFCRTLALLVTMALLPASAAILRDVDGNDHSLPADPGGKATVMYFVTHDCPISNRYGPEIQRICDEYSPRGVRCVMAYVDPLIGAEEIQQHRRAYGGKQPAVHDKDHFLASLAGATVTPESAVFDAAGKLVYLGRIDNLYAALGTPRRKATERDLRDALDELLAGDAVSRPRTQAVGCFIPDLQVLNTGDSP